MFYTYLQTCFMVEGNSIPIKWNLSPQRNFTGKTYLLLVFYSFFIRGGKNSLISHGFTSPGFFLQGNFIPKESERNSFSIFSVLQKFETLDTNIG